jgi:hypothetical protein
MKTMTGRQLWARRLLAAISVAAILVATTSAEARKRRRRSKKSKQLHLVVESKRSLEQRLARPTFTPAQPMRVMDRGRMVYVGKGILAEPHHFYLLRLSDLKRVRVTVPFAAYVGKNPGIQVFKGDSRPIHKQFHITKLLFYDSQNQEAGAEVSDRIGTSRVIRHFYVQWDLKTGSIKDAPTLVTRTRAGQSYSHSLPLGYDYKKREFIYLRQLIAQQNGSQGGTAGGAPRTVFVIGFSGGKPRVIADFKAQRSTASKTYFDAAHRRAMLVEYAELASKGPPPSGHLIDLKAGKVRSFAIPLTTYGVAFGAKGKKLYAYSSQLGQIWTIDQRSGKKQQQLSVGKLGHEINRVSPWQLLLLRNNGLRFFHIGKKGLRRGRWVPIKRIYTGFSHVGGSLVVCGRALIKNGDDLHIVSIK